MAARPREDWSADVDRPASAAIFQRNRRLLPGGCASLNRKVEPEIAFVCGEGAYLWDADGNRYVDYHAAFAPHLLGYAHPEVDGAVRRALDEQWPLAGSGAAPWEGRAAELVCQMVPSVERVQFTTSGSEATYHALRLARAATGRTDIVVMQGGYNGWHDEVACNVMSPLEEVGEPGACGELPYLPLSSGIGPHAGEHVHVIPFNNLNAARHALETHPVACLLTEPILQNIGVVKPVRGFLEGLRTLCDRTGALLVFDEVKTGFRAAPGGYQSLAGVTPDLSVFGKAIANGYPLGAIGGRRDIMDLFDTPDPSRRVMISGTYNGHPLVMAAAIATMEHLRRSGEALYARLDGLGARLQEGMERAFSDSGVVATVVRQGSAFCAYFMDHAPVSWHDIAHHHVMQFDLAFRRALIDRGVYLFPLPTKQGSISTAHSAGDVDFTIERVSEVLSSLRMEP